MRVYNGLAAHQDDAHAQQAPPSDPPLYDQATFAQRSDVLDIVLDHVPQGIVVIGPDYRLLAFNKPILRLFQLSEGAFRVGRDFREIIDTWVRETGQDEAMRMRPRAELDLREPFTFELEQQVRGETRWVVLTHDPLPGGGCVRTFTDITENLRGQGRITPIDGKQCDPGPFCPRMPLKRPGHL